MTLAHLPWRAIIFGSLVGLAAALADVYDFSGFLVNNELKAINGQFALRGPRTPTAPVVIITIDEDSSPSSTCRGPGRGLCHGKLIDIVTRGKPVAIALDILFLEPSARGPADDEALAQAIARWARWCSPPASARSGSRAGSRRSAISIRTAPAPRRRRGLGPREHHHRPRCLHRRSRLTLEFQGKEWAGFDLDL